MMSKWANGKPLYQDFPKYYSVLMVAGFLINIGMLLYSQLDVSAVVKSSICVGEGCPTVSLVELSQISACNNTNDLSIFSDPSEAPIWANNEETQRLLGIECLQQGSLDFDTCVQLFIDSNVTDDPSTPGLDQFSVDCVECFVATILCASNNCRSACISSISGPATPECVDCTTSKCLSAFDQCAGVQSPPYDPFNSSRTDVGEQVLDYVCTSRVENNIVMFDVFVIKFLESIDLAWQGGVYLLAILVAVASGIWPHVKNILMAISWFAPLSDKQRDRILTFLAYVGKWSLVDVFFVVLLLVGVKIDKYLGLTVESAIIVLVESRIGIYLFGTAAIMALLQGEYMRHLARKVREQNTGKGDGTMDVDSGNWKKQVAVASCSFLAFIFGILGVVLPIVRFQISGVLESNAGPNVYEYSAISLATAIVDECAIDCNDSRCGNGSVAGTYYLAIMFAVMGIFLPLLTYAYGVFAALFPMNHPKRKQVHQLFKSMSYFAAMDIFFFSLLVLISRFADLLNASVGGEVAEACGVDTAEECISFTGTLEIGTWMILVSIIFFWLTQIGIAAVLSSSKGVGQVATVSEDSKS